jgi:hypothetical protein
MSNIDHESLLRLGMIASSPPGNRNAKRLSRREYRAIMASDACPFASEFSTNPAD